MKKINFMLLAVFCFTVTFLSLYSCSLFSDPVVKIDSNTVAGEKVPTLNSETVGIIWDKNAADTNINQDNAGFVLGAAVADPCVIKKDGIYHIWFTGISNVGENSKLYTIRYAYSNDGITWRNDNVSNIALASTASTGSSLSDDAKGVRLGSVIWDDDASEFRMWYRGMGDDDNKWRILFARSKKPDTDWVKHPNTYISPESKTPKSIMGLGANGFDSQQIGDLSVLKRSYYDGYEYHHFYEMWYSAEGARSGSGGENGINDAKFRIMYAKSSDGLVWEKEALPVLEPDQGAFDFLRKDCPAVIYDTYKGSKYYKMWYLGEAMRPDPEDDELEILVRRFGLAYAYSGEAFEFYDPAVYTDGLAETTFPYPETDEESGVTYHLKDPWVIRDGYTYEMWYVVEKKSAGGILEDSKIRFVESW